MSDNKFETIRNDCREISKQYLSIFKDASIGLFEKEKICVKSLAL